MHGKHSFISRQLAGQAWFSAFRDNSVAVLTAQLNPLETTLSVIGAAAWRIRLRRQCNKGIVRAVTTLMRHLVEMLGRREKAAVKPVHPIDLSQIDTVLRQVRIGAD